jgi:hypothetical protein
MSFAFFIAAAWLGLARGSTPVIRTLEFHEDFERGDLSAWDFPFPEDWQILAEGPNHFLHMLRSRPPGVPRRPLQFALLGGPKVGSFDFRARLRREGRSMIVVYGYVDTLHFNYVHLSVDRGTEQPVHNGIFMVNGAPRIRIAGTDARPALPDRDWHNVRIVRNAKSELTEVFMDDSKRPLFSKTAPQYACGRLGIGSFDETGDFDDIHVHSDDADCESSDIFRPASVK